MAVDYLFCRLRKESQLWSTSASQTISRYWDALLGVLALNPTRPQLCYIEYILSHPIFIVFLCSVSTPATALILRLLTPCKTQTGAVTDIGRAATQACTRAHVWAQMQSQRLRPLWGNGLKGSLMWLHTTLGFKQRDKLLAVRGQEINVWKVHREKLK